MGTKITIRYGNEGPTHDPYSYTELRVEREAVVCVGHFGGIKCYVDVTKNGETNRANDREFSVGYLEELFRAVTGGYPHEWEHWLTKARSKCRNCGFKVLDAVNGYPGETLYQCRKCREVSFSVFNIRAVE